MHMQGAVEHQYVFQIITKFEVLGSFVVNDRGVYFDSFEV